MTRASLLAAALVAAYLGASAYQSFHHPRPAAQPQWMKKGRWPYQVIFDGNPWCFSGASSWNCTMHTEAIPSDPSPIMDNSGRLQCPFSTVRRLIGHPPMWAVCERQT